ncbi:MAG: recombinase zinc beta ribbon domain-containing protein [Candidatus Sungbacteria bacterium]|nr:recombinase zinc beta ribbon domain-containing protein [bacterium]MDZ4285820.1 recombinase zinc beta ribbon domain-containing protein [Candidatus Sungbacteria bacterium]
MSRSAIYKMFTNPFYAGILTYYGTQYEGKHEPMITKELFDVVQEQVKSQLVRSEGKEFAFTKLMVCGLCGSGMTADEKFKKQKNGNIHRHVYYGCTKSKDKDCKCGYINETDLIKQFEELIDRVDMDEIGVHGKIKEEVERFKKFQGSLLGKIIAENIDIRNYAKYLLCEGTDAEKRGLLGCLKGKIVLATKTISLLK